MIKEIALKWKKYIALGIIVATITLLFTKNFEMPEFFKASFVDIITIILAVFITYYLTEKNNNIRRRNDCIEHILLEIEEMINDEIFFSTNKRARQHQSSCANRIKYIKEAGFYDIQEEINFIEEKFDEIRDLYSNHSQNKNELKKVFIDFERYRDYICDKCNKIRVEMYKI